MRVLELLLRIILKLIDILSSKPSDDKHDEEVEEDSLTIDASGYSSERLNQTSKKKKSPASSDKSVVCYNEEVSCLISEILSTHEASHRADMNEIARLRNEVSRLQKELIISKADISKLRSKIAETTDKESGEDGR